MKALGCLTDISEYQIPSTALSNSVSMWLRYIWAWGKEDAGVHAMNLVVYHNLFSAACFTDDGGKPLAVDHKS